jgi:hypothetical protein
MEDDETIKEILNLLRKLEIRIYNIENKCSKMDNHITFIENTYNILRTPLNFIKHRVEYYTGNINNTELPKLENNTNTITNTNTDTNTK